METMIGPLDHHHHNHHHLHHQQQQQHQQQLLKDPEDPLIIAASNSSATNAPSNSRCNNLPPLPPHPFALINCAISNNNSNSRSAPAASLLSPNSIQPASNVLLPAAAPPVHSTSPSVQQQHQHQLQQQQLVPTAYE